MARTNLSQRKTDFVLSTRDRGLRPSTTLRSRSYLGAAGSRSTTAWGSNGTRLVAERSFSVEGGASAFLARAGAFFTARAVVCRLYDIVGRRHLPSLVAIGSVATRSQRHLPTLGRPRRKSIRPGSADACRTLFHTQAQFDHKSMNAEQTILCGGADLIGRLKRKTITPSNGCISACGVIRLSLIRGREKHNRRASSSSRRGPHGPRSRGSAQKPNGLFSLALFETAEPEAQAPSKTWRRGE